MGEVVQFIPKANPNRVVPTSPDYSLWAEHHIVMMGDKVFVDTAPSEWNCDSGDCA